MQIDNCCQPIMKASISFPELQHILLEKAGVDITFAFVNEKTISVTYPVSIGIIKKNISVDLTVEELKGSDMLLLVSGGMGTEILINTVLGLLQNKIPEGLFEKKDAKHFLVHLDTIEQVKPVFDAINVDDFKVLHDGLQVEGVIKSNS